MTKGLFTREEFVDGCATAAGNEDLSLVVDILIAIKQAAFWMALAQVVGDRTEMTRRRQVIEDLQWGKQPCTCVHHLAGHRAQVRRKEG